MKFFKYVLLFGLVSIILGVGSVFGMYLYFKDELPSVEVLQDVKLQTPMRIYTQDGKLISQYGVKRRIPVSLDEVPETLVQALIATEDSRFYEHIGVDPIGVLRAAMNLIITGEKGQGASTLTMQLARGFFGLTRKKEYSRKIKEVFIALKMERELTKDQILELYLNKVELGHRSFGVGAAAQVYYGKTLQELTLAQIATLAGLPQRPSVLNPISGPELSVERRRIVLLRMLDEGYITRAEFDEAASAPVTAKKHGAEIDVDAPYLADIAYSEMIEVYGKEIAETSGFKVYTTAHSETQIAAQRALIQNLHDYDERHGYRGPLAQIWEAVIDDSIDEQNPEAPNINNEPLTEQAFTESEDGAAGEEDDSTNQTVTDATQLELAQNADLSLDFVPNSAMPELSEIDKILAETEVIGGLIPAAVLRVEDKSILVRTLEQGELTITWDGLDWARPYINDHAQGPEPEFATDIVQEGALGYVRKRFQDDVWQLAQFPLATSAFVSLDPFDGAVEAVVGGYSFYHSQFNRATQAKRQVGSNIKPFVYAAALDSGYTLASLVNDAPINQWDASSGIAWRPQNSPAIYDGPIRMRVALGKSKNVISVRLLRGVGLTETRDYVTKFGFDRNEVPLDETMSLGSGAHTPMEVATALATIANGGFGVRPYFIERIESSEGVVIWQAEPEYACDPCDEYNRDGSRKPLVEESESLSINENDIEALLAAEFMNQSNDVSESVNEITPPPMVSAPRVISEQTAFLVAEMMRTAVRANGSWNNKTYWMGTGWRARNILQRTDIGGKTGTTNDSRDTWFSGFAPGLVATSWVGFDDNVRQLGRASRNQNLINKNPEKFNFIGNAMIGGEDGAKAAQPAWIYFMQSVLADVDEQVKSIPEGVVRVRIDRNTGKLTNKTDASSMFEYFVKGTEPTIFVEEDNFELPLEEEQEKTPELEELF